MKEANILLINPPYPFFWETETIDHLGLGYIASYLKSRGYKNVEIFNFGLLPASALRPYLGIFRPTHVGISVPYTQAYPNALAIAQMVKEANSDTIVVMGGAHPSYDPMGVILNQNVDYVVKGEGEVAFCLMLEGTAEPIIECPVEDLDALPFPDRPLLNKNHIGVITSRGCPFSCTFCSSHVIWGRKWRARSPENVIKEIKLLDVPFVSFDDDNLNLDRDRAEELFLLLKKECKIQWNTPNGLFINTLDHDLLKLMKEAGCYGIVVPIESGDDFIRNKVMGKSSKRKKIKEVVESCRDLGILTLGCFVIGMPQENMDSMHRSLEFAKELMLDALNVSMATPYPGTQLYQQCVDNGYLRTNDFSAFNALESCLIETPYLKAEEVDKFRQYFIDEFTKYHDERNSVTTDEKRRMIRRPYENWEMSNRSN